MICGAIMPDGVSPFLKVFITSETHMVVGYIGQGSSAELQSMWESPFGNDSLGGMAGAVSSAAGKVASTAQAMSDQTTKSTFNSLLIWEGQTPPTFNLVIDLMATMDAKVEVNDAISTLLQMESPELAAMAATGRRPTPVILDIGRRLKLMDVVIQNVSYQLDVPKTAQGYYTHNTVTLQCSGMAVQNQSDIPYMFI
ncbi:hypothetical protein I5398_21840 [Citrobacter freundii]|jgi:hypothetical protein|nr:hypothetical protein [Escherichia coli]EIJ9084887.1 hypothetical protein [Citrobacter freundii]DAW18619.1 MAG TPA: hypothetical protein [Caudoviricetes sp.]EJH9549678.1 hypothetical protein [Citrobacter freundii]EJO6485812.1 hypothetical protein [Citrobacter freundii]